MGLHRDAYKSLTESVVNAVQPQKEISEENDLIDEIIAEGIEIYGEEDMIAILEDFAETGEMSEELAELIEDLQTQARFDEMGKKIIKASDYGGQTLRAKDYAERNSKKIYGRGGKVVGRKKGGKYRGVPKFEREIVAYNKAWFPGLNRHPGRMP